MNPPRPYSGKTTAVVVTTAMLTFISYWRAAAVVLCDMSSSAYYACAVAEQMIGKAAPWFILAIMILSLLFRTIFMESSVMFVRGGVYNVVKAAMGSTVGKIAISALLFDFILTGPISAVAAGQYIIGFCNQLTSLLGHPEWHLPRDTFAVIVAFVIILYFWRKNVIGVEESSEKSLRIMQLTTVMIVVLLVWCGITALYQPIELPPFTPHLSDESLGWLKDIDWVRTIGSLGVLIALGHSVLAMSGEETLGQIYREIAAPKVRNLKRAALLIFTYSFLLTGVMSFFAVVFVPDQVRPSYQDNLLSGLAMYLIGPAQLKIVLQGFVVVVGALLLSGAVNTAMVGANGALNRMAEDGVLPGWLRQLHRRYGTTHRIIHGFAVLQLVIVLLSRGDVVMLGEAYAFGVIWSFVFIAIAVLILRWKDKSPREFRVPFNIDIGRFHMPVGLLFICTSLLLIALANFFTKSTATKYGLLFTGACFGTLVLFERWNRRHRDGLHHLEKVNLAFQDEATPAVCKLMHSHRILVAARDPHNLTHLRRVLERMDPKKSDLVVMTVRRTQLPTSPAEELPIDEQVFITNVVALAEKFGVHVTPLVVAASDPIYATAKAAFDLGANEIVLGRSGRTNPEVQLEKLAMAWGFVAAEKPHRIVLRVAWPQKEIKFEIG